MAELYKADDEQPDWAVFGDTQGTGDHNWYNTTTDSSGGGPLPQDEHWHSENNDFEEWQEFSSTKDSLRNNTETQPVDKIVADDGGTVSLCSATSLVNQAIKTCFPLPENSNTQEHTQMRDLDDQRCLSDLLAIVSLTNFDWSRCLIKDQYFLAMLALEQERSENGEHVDCDVDLSGFDTFDWSVPTDPHVRRDSTTSADSSGVRFSPQDNFQEIFRGTTGRAVDSPIEIEFDHNKAVLGLSILPSSDLLTMKNEMSGKITKLSNELVSLLQNRDMLLLETVTKNRFIQAMLKVQESKMAVQQNNDLLTNSSDMSTEVMRDEGGHPPSANGGVSTGGNEVRQKRRSRSRSLQHISRSILARAKNLRTVEDDKSSNEMLMRVVIPYRQESGSTETSWNIPVLNHWTKILQAMADKNPNVSNLVSNYLSSVIDSIPDTNDSADSGPCSDSRPGPHSHTNGPHSCTNGPHSDPRPVSHSNTNGPHTSFQQFQVSD